VQIYGSKSVCLFSPDASAFMHPCAAPQANTSSIPFSKMRSPSSSSGSAGGVEFEFSEEHRNLVSSLSTSSHPQYYAQLEAGNVYYKSRVCIPLSVESSHANMFLYCNIQGMHYLSLSDGGTFARPCQATVVSIFGGYSGTD
jgi:hypothetical protein